MFIRTDGSLEIGMGHLIRCFSLAGELKKRKIEITFCIKNTCDKSIERLTRNGYEILRIPEKLPLDQEPEYIASFAREKECEVIIVDGYSFPFSYYKRLKDKIGSLVVIDDMADKKYICDILLNQNINASEGMYVGKTISDTMLLLGPTYALLRPKFKKYYPVQRNFGHVRNILITMGGGDPFNQTLKAMKALEIIKNNFSITAIIGPNNPNKESIIEYLRVSQRKIEIFEDIDNIEESMLEADIAICAGGSTSWEICCLGLPMVQIVVSDNQQMNVEELCRRGLSVNLGDYEKVEERDIVHAIEDLLNDVEKRKTMSSASKKTVDGKGAERVADEVCAGLL